VQIEDAAVTEETRRVREVVEARLTEADKAHHLPLQLRPGFDVELDEDLDGELAFRVWLRIDPSRNPSREDVSRLVELTSGIGQELARAGLRHWAYVDVRPAS
jgi:hypothetical protein